jgi:hypothetical protein
LKGIWQRKDRRRASAPGAADFAMHLLSPPGQASLKAFGFIPVALPAE